MTDFYSQNRCVCSTRSHGPLLCAVCLSFHFNQIDICLDRFINITQPIIITTCIDLLWTFSAQSAYWDALVILMTGMLTGLIYNA